MGDYFIALTHLIEDTYKLNGNQPVVLIGHSMGNLYALYLLQQHNDSWKEKYIRSFVSLAAPWGGAVKPIRLLSSGRIIEHCLFLLVVLKFLNLHLSFISSE